MDNISFFDGNQKFKIDKPIRLIELFGGYGSQHFALEYLGVNFEQWKLCEWAVKSIQAYKDAHCQNDNTDYSKDLTKEQIVEYLVNKGISADYNKPMTYDQVKRLSEDKLRTIYNNIKATHNLVNIQQAHAKDFEIVDTNKYIYICTYSFPCQDLSKAGLGKGMAKDSGTRSGMLWEVERILDECENLPQVLVMENVPDVIGTKNIEHFAKWLEKLESLGYHCYWQVLNAKDYGVPQNRERCFMVSILGDYYYEFPKAMKLEKRLKDLLENTVAENYYLSDRMVEYFEKHSKECESKGLLDSDCRAWKSERISGTLTCKGNNKIVTNEPVAYDEQNNYIRKDGCIGTLTTDGSSPKHNNRIIELNLKQKLCNDLITSGKVKEYDVIRHSYSTNRMEKMYIQNKVNHDCSPTLDTRCDCLGVCTNYRIRKLTPKECFRLMGVKDQDYEKIAKNQSNASLYHLAGDSIVVDVLVEIFRRML